MNNQGFCGTAPATPDLLITDRVLGGANMFIKTQTTSIKKKIFAQFVQKKRPCKVEMDFYKGKELPRERFFYQREKSKS